MVASSDFKTIKAKVGKRAPAKANVTDTSFQSTTIRVSHQSAVATAEKSVTNDTSNSLTTARGLTLAQLITQLLHPAPAAQISALKGLEYILTTYNTNTIGGWHPHVSQLLLAIGPAALVHDDAEVRAAGRQTLTCLVEQLRRHGTHGTSNMLLLPFLPYLSALVSTALNSLDREQCQDGAGMAIWLASSVVGMAGKQNDKDDNNVTSATTELNVAPLILPLTRLLSNDSMSRGSGWHGGQAAIPVGSMRKSVHKKKRKRHSAQAVVPANDHATTSARRHDSPKLTVLLAIQALLSTKTTTTYNDNAKQRSRETYNRSSSSTLIKADRSSHLIFLRTPPIHRARQRKRKIGLLDLSAFANTNNSTNKEENEIDDDDADGRISMTNHHHHCRSSTSTLSPTAALDLFDKLRDCGIEATQNKHVQIFLVCCSNVRLLLNTCSTALLLLNDGGGVGDCTTADSIGINQRRLLKLCSQVAKCIREVFRQLKSPTHQAALCQTLLDLAVTVRRLTHTSNDVKEWTDLVASHMEDQLVLNQDNQSSPLSVELMAVLEQILLEAELLDSEMRFELVRLLMESFLPTTTTTNDASSVSNSRNVAVCSAAGRRAVVLVCRMLKACSYNAKRVKQMYGLSLDHAVCALPRTLLQWKSMVDCMSETTECMATIHAAVIQQHSSEASSDIDYNNLRLAVGELLTPHDGEILSLCEQYPEGLQRQLIALISMLSSPTVSTVKNLGAMCARCYRKTGRDGDDSSCISPSTASFIIQCVHTVRKTIPMQGYVGFLFDSTAILSDWGPTAIDEHLIASAKRLDEGLKVASSCMIECGTAKILPMLTGVFRSLLEKTSEDDAILTRRGGDLMHARGAISMLAMLSMDLTPQTHHHHTASSSRSFFLFVPDSFVELVVHAVAVLLSVAWPTSDGSSSDSLSLSTTYWIQPMTALLASEPRLLGRVFATIATQILPRLDPARQTHVLLVWLSILLDPTIDVRGHHEDLSAGVAVVRESSSVSSGDGGAVSRVLGRISAELTLVKGQQIQQQQASNQEHPLILV